jgi:hypothetical protein
VAFRLEPRPALRRLRPAALADLRRPAAPPPAAGTARGGAAGGAAAGGAGRLEGLVRFGWARAVNYSGLAGLAWPVAPGLPEWTRSNRSAARPTGDGGVGDGGGRGGGGGVPWLRQAGGARRGLYVSPPLRRRATPPLWIPPSESALAPAPAPDADGTRTRAAVAPPPATAAPAPAATAPAAATAGGGGVRTAERGDRGRGMEGSCPPWWPVEEGLEDSEGRGKV